MGTMPVSGDLRQKLIDTLLQQGFILSDGKLVSPDVSDKDNIRQMHAHLRMEKLKEARSWLLSSEERVLSCFANGPDVDVERIYPRLELVDTQHKADIFRYASLMWSVPISAGYGRRMRFLVFDEHNNKLIGIFALGDPVYNLKVRDRWIGWGVPEKMNGCTT